MVDESFHAAAPFIERSIHRARSDDNLSRRHALAIVPCCHQLCQGCATRNATSFVQHRGTMQTRYDGDSGTRRLLQLGYRQTLQRPLMWTSNCAICLGIMSPLTAITGIQACTYKPNFFRVSLRCSVVKHTVLRRFVQPGATVWRACCAHLELGVHRGCDHSCWTCYE